MFQRNNFFLMSKSRMLRGTFTKSMNSVPGYLARVYRASCISTC